MKVLRHRRLVVGFLLPFLLLPALVQGAEREYLFSPSAIILSVTGRVEVEDPNGGRTGGLQGYEGMKVLAGQTIVTPPGGGASLRLNSGEEIYLGGNRRVTLVTFFNATKSKRWDESSKRRSIVPAAVRVPVFFFVRVRQRGLDMEEETLNTLASARG